MAMASIFVLISCFLYLSEGNSPVLHDWLSSKTNLWEQLASKVLNVSDFCLSSGVTATDLFSTCLIGIPESLEVFRNYTIFEDIPSKPMSYGDLPAWGRAALEREPHMVAMKLARSLPASNCFQVSSCEGKCHHLPMDNSQNCTQIETVSYMKAHVVLPQGWFFLCGQTAYSYLPANTTMGYCALGRLSLFLPSKKDLDLAHSSGREARAIQNFDPNCDSSIVLRGIPQFVAAALFTPGVAAGMNYRSIKHLACAMVKNLNYTSQALASVAYEMHELREAILDNRAAIDFLLMKNHYGCQQVRHMCCFNLTDQTPSIQKEVTNLRDLASGIQETIGFDLSFLTSWLPSLDWLRKGFLILLGFIFMLLLLSCCGTHLPPLIRSCFRRNRGGSAQQMPLLQLLGYNSVAVALGRVSARPPSGELRPSQAPPAFKYL